MVFLISIELLLFIVNAYRELSYEVLLSLEVELQNFFGILKTEMFYNKHFDSISHLIQN